MTDFLELCKNRFSERDYLEKEVEQKKIEYIIEAARLAPSAVNYQPWMFIVVREPQNRVKVQESYHRDWFKKAPCYIIMCADKDQSWKRKVDMKDFADVDVAIATEHLCLAATEQGLGTCWVCNFDPKILNDNFSLPENIEPIAIISVGYPANAEHWKQIEKTRKPIEEIVRWEKF